MAILADFAFAALVALSTAFSGAGRPPGAEPPPTAEEIVSTLEHAQSLVQNLEMFTVNTAYHRTTPLDPPKDKDFRHRNITRFVYDNKGNIRIEEEEQLPDTSGNYVRGWHVVVTWDNEKEMTLDETPEHRTVIIHAENNIRSHWTPTGRIGVQGEPVATVMKGLMASGGEIGIELPDSGRVLVNLRGFPKDTLKSVRLELDPDRMFYPLRIEVYKGDKLVRTVVSEPQDAGGGVWVPKNVSTKEFAYDGDTQALDFEEELVVEKARVNVPDLDPNVFKIELTPETLIRDLREPVAVDKYHGTGKLSKIEEEQFTKGLLKDKTVAEPGSAPAAQPTPPAASKIAAVDAKPDKTGRAYWIGLAVIAGSVALTGLGLVKRRARL